MDQPALVTSLGRDRLELGLGLGLQRGALILNDVMPIPCLWLHKETTCTCTIVLLSLDTVIWVIFVFVPNVI